MGVGTGHQPRSARSWGLAMRAVGRHEGARGAAPFACLWGVQGWALPLARPPVPRACGRGPLPTGCGCWGCQRWDPSPTRQRALLRACFACCGGGTRAPGGGGGASCLGLGRPGLGAVPRPTAHHSGVRPGTATHWLWVRGVWAREPVTKPTLGRSCKVASRSFGSAHGRPGGGRLLRGCEASEVGRSPTPDRPSFGRAAEVRYPQAVGAGDVGVGPRYELHRARSCELALRALGRH